MAFCKFSSEFIISNQTSVDNLFISQFLPYAPDNAIKVYLYGLYKCTNPTAYDNDIEYFAKELGLSEQDIEDAFAYWQDQGLVQVLFTSPIQIRYLPLKNVLNNTKKFKKDKFEAFNLQAQEILEGRMITSNEYAEYYTFMEAFHIEPTALIMTMQFCTEMKGKNVGYAYILTVARNWANEGITTTKSVEEKIKTLNQACSELGVILKICGLKRLATVDEQEKYIKWTENWEFKPEVIISVAKQLSGNASKVNFGKIDAKLAKYFELKKFSIAEIQGYEQEKLEMYDIAKKLNKTIGVYYENLENVVDVYISKWLDLGHNEKSLLTLANYCFKNSIRTLEGMDNTILKLYKLGIVSEQAINQYINNLMLETAEIKSILEKLELSRNVILQDRVFFKTWKYSWLVNDELLCYAIELSCGKALPMQYMNKLLSTWHNENITTVEKAKICKVENPKANIKKTTEKKLHYSKEDVSVLFDSLEEIEL